MCPKTSWSSDATGARRKSTRESAVTTGAGHSLRTPVRAPCSATGQTSQVRRSARVACQTLHWMRRAIRTLGISAGNMRMRCMFNSMGETSRTVRSTTAKRTTTKVRLDHRMRGLRTKLHRRRSTLHSGPHGARHVHLALQSSFVKAAELADTFAGRAATSMAHRMCPCSRGQCAEHRQADSKKTLEMFAHRLIKSCRQSNFAKTHALQERLISSTLPLHGAESMASLAG